MSEMTRTNRSDKNRDRKNRRSPQLEVRGWRIAFLVLCTIGACLSADLLRLHVNVHTNPDYQSYCAMSERVNCETVAASDWAVMAGLPVALWGLLFYVALAGLAVWGLRPRLRVPGWPFGALFWLSAAASAGAVFFFVISHFVIESVCIVCAGTYLVNIGLLVAAWRELRRVGKPPLLALRDELVVVVARPAPRLAYATVFALALVACWTTLPTYWKVDVSTGPGGLSVGTTGDGHPWIGARNPEVEIVEYSDYQCPHCLRGHGEMRRLVEAYPDRVRLVHRNFPLDRRCNPEIRKPFHAEACFYARVAHCAGEQGAFWEANDYLFRNGRRRDRVTVGEIAEALGRDAGELQTCVDGSAAARSVQEDLAAGRARSIRGTPTFVIEDRIYPGRIPDEVIAEALNLER
jgi:protein-disulfide isomerase/uncharacterized membrane protein